MSDRIVNAFKSGDSTPPAFLAEVMDHVSSGGSAGDNSLSAVEIAGIGVLSAAALYGVGRLGLAGLRGAGLVGAAKVEHEALSVGRMAGFPLGFNRGQYKGDLMGIGVSNLPKPGRFDWLRDLVRREPHHIPGL